MDLVGRSAQVEKLVDVLARRRTAQHKLTILPIFGPGGVGKSSLLLMAESTVDYRKLKTSRIHIDGSSTISSLPDFVKRLVLAVKTDAKQRYGRSEITLPETEAAFGALRDILAEAEKETTSDQAEAFKKVIDVALRSGKALNRISKKSKELLDVERIEEAIGILKPGDAIRALQNELPNLANIVGIGAKAKNLRNALRENAARTLAEAFVNDLTVLLRGYGLKDSVKLKSERIAGCASLTLILDDYEHLVEHAGPFVVNYLLPMLRDSRIDDAVVVISGRDDVRDTDPSWDQHLQSNLLPGINVGPLMENEIGQIAASEDVDHNKLWADTEGYPYFIQLWIEASKSGETALSHKRFYDRTTRWMDAQQQGWLRYCVVLDDVNLDTLTAMSRSREDASRIFEWFKNESSLRATDTGTWTVRRYIRTRLCKYLELEDPSGFAALRNRSINIGRAA